MRCTVNSLLEFAVDHGSAHAPPGGAKYQTRAGHSAAPIIGPLINFFYFVTRNGRGLYVLLINSDIVWILDFFLSSFNVLNLWTCFWNDSNDYGLYVCVM